MHIYVHTWCVCVCVCVCVCNACMHTHVHTLCVLCMHACICACMRTYACMHACVHTYIQRKHKIKCLRPRTHIRARAHTHTHTHTQRTHTHTQRTHTYTQHTHTRRNRPALASTPQRRFAQTGHPSGLLVSVGLFCRIHNLNRSFCRMNRALLTLAHTAGLGWPLVLLRSYLEWQGPVLGCQHAGSVWLFAIRRCLPRGTR